jgi:pimeloyl-ACP methyl ester carboxylesterase
MTEFRPTEVWQPDTEGFVYEEAIEHALRAINQKNPLQLVENLITSVERSEQGAVFAVLKGEQSSEYSSSDAAVMFNPFANGASPNMLIRAEFIREVFKYADIRDAEGKLMPVAMLAAPALNGSNLNLSREDKDAIKQGELGPFARELLRAVSEKEIGKVVLFGFSQGADVALAGARTAYSANLDTEALSVGDPAGVEARSLLKLIKDFKAAAPDLEERANKSGIDALKSAREEKWGMTKFVLSVLHPHNRFMLAGALGSNTFQDRIQELINEDNLKKIVVAYGGESTISAPSMIEPAIEKLYEAKGQDSFVSIRVDSAQHSWGDQLTLLAKLYLRALK